MNLLIITSRVSSVFFLYIVNQGRERSECGKIKSILNNPSRGTKDTFERDLKSNAIGDEFVDPGQYFLRKPDNNSRLKKQAVNVGGSVSHSNIFNYSGSNKKVKHSEFQHLHNGPALRATPEPKKNFLTRFTYETFQKKIPYTEDLYENKEELIKMDYVNRRNQILVPGLPYTTTVKQHGTFYNERITFGEDRDFPQVGWLAHL